MPTGRRNLIKRAWKRSNRFGKNIIGGSTVLNQDFLEFAKSLNANRVRYLVVGGYAVALHGHPRYTKDIDVWIEMTPKNAAKLIQALDEFGFGALGLKSIDFLVPDQIIQLGYPPSRIDLLTSIPGVDFGDCYRSRVRAKFGGVRINFIDLENLKKSKKASGRTQDLADLENLE
ncbi:MAG: DUF6036 family nucleotidyltransferase [Anaerolineae bacterium]